MRKIFLVALVCLFCFSCKKKNLTFYLYGNVTALNDNSPVSGVTVKVYGYKMGSTIKHLIKTTQTNPDGNYDVSVNRERYEKLKLQLSKKNYFSTSKIWLFDDLSAEDDNVSNLKISPKSWTRFTIQTTEADTLKLYKFSGKTDCDLCQPNGNSYFYGESTSFIWPNDGGTFMAFHYWINVDSIHVYDSVYNTPFDTINYTINY